MGIKINLAKTLRSLYQLNPRKGTETKNIDPISFTESRRFHRLNPRKGIETTKSYLK
ncbi:hypothetical protein [Coleofasciculus sp. E1-EBD-02]|uniref:hypothetical protein n=1 Tax=Coleofasciculus sp. E1-EBD-02 TaxID=3068481 RepID=UPI003301B342